MKHEPLPRPAAQSTPSLSEGELSELRFNVQANEFPFAGEGVDAAGGRGSGKRSEKTFVKFGMMI
ncbi:MAG: hypothetical protein LBO08_01480 [Rickettsiales bacterium]|jgi:hypothetical protein|nr:hypothetical protein [Rickettsiales bacterium]